MLSLERFQANQAANFKKAYILLNKYKNMKELIVNKLPENYVAAVGTSAEAIAYLALTGKLITGETLRNTFKEGKICPELKKDPANVYFEIRPSAYVEQFIDLSEEDRKKYDIRSKNPNDYDMKYLTEPLGLVNAQEQCVWDYLTRTLGVGIYYAGTENEDLFTINPFIEYIEELRKGEREDFTAQDLAMLRFDNLTGLARLCSEQDLDITSFSEVEKAYDAAVELSGVVVYLRDTFKREDTRILDSPFDKYFIQTLLSNKGNFEQLEVVDSIPIEQIAGIYFTSPADLRVYKELSK